MKRVRKIGIFTILFFVMSIGLFSIASLYVATLFAQADEIITEEVPVERVELFADCEDNVRPNDVINLSVTLFPDYSVETVKNLSFVVTKGNEYVEQDGSKLTVQQNAKIGGEIGVVAVVDGVYSNKLNFKIVSVPVTKLFIKNQETFIRQNETLQLDVNIEPFDATNKNLYYKIVDGKDYAIINQRGLISVKDNLPAGDLSILVKVESLSNPNISEEKRFNLYVPTRKLLITASNENPREGETIALDTIIDKTATKVELDFRIISGGKYVKNLAGNKLTVVDAIQDFNPSITVGCLRDGIETQKTFEIYIAPTAIEFVNPLLSIKQGGMVIYKVQPTPLNATMKNLTFTLSDYDNASISDDGLFTAKILPEKRCETVSVIAKVDDVSENILVEILRPRVSLSANHLTPYSSSDSAQEVKLTTLIDGKEVNGLEFTVKKGEKFIDGKIENGSFKLVKNIKDFDPEIIISTIYESWESNELVIRPYIVMEALSIENTEIIEVEPQCSYVFDARCYPQNATGRKDGLTYSLNVDETIATIKNGTLKIGKNAHAGTKITISVNGTDGLMASHEVKVKRVYATTLNIDKIENQKGDEIFDGDEIFAGDKLSFKISFPKPFNVSEEQKVFLIERVSGIEVECKENEVFIPSQDKITEKNPYVTLKISSVQGREVLSHQFTFKIHIKVTEIAYEQLVTKVGEGQIKQLNELVVATAKPDNSDVRKINFAISGHAKLVGESITVEDKLDRGDYKFTLILTCEDVSVELDFVIYVKTEQIGFEADNLAPMTMKDGGERVELSIKKDMRATDQMTVKILKGAVLINGNYQDGDVVPLDFNAEGNAKFKFNITKSENVGQDKLLQFEASQGEISQVLNINIYKPIEELTVRTDSIENGFVYVERGQENVFSVLFSDYASETNLWTVDIPEIDISNRTNPTISIPSNVVAYTTYRAVFSTNDRMNKQFTVTFTVKPFDDTMLRFEGKKFGALEAPFTVDSEGDEFLAEYPTFWVGRYADTHIDCHGFTLSEYGLGISRIYFTVDGESNLCEFELLDDSRLRFYIKENAAGNKLVDLQIFIKDGEKFERGYCWQFFTFRPLSGQPILKTGMIVNEETKLELDYGTLDKNANFSINDIIFKGSDLTGISIDGNGLLKVTHDSASEYQTVILGTSYLDSDNKTKYVQSYNGKGIDYPVDGAPITLQIKIHRIKLDNQGGNGDTSICAVDSRSTKVNIPTRTGYVFTGYYTTSSGGIQYYDENGNLLVQHSNYASIDVIYARWEEIQYYISVYKYCSKDTKCKDASSGGGGSSMLLVIMPPMILPGTGSTKAPEAYVSSTGWISYTQNYTLNAISWNGHKFKKWTINGVDYSNSNITVKQLTATHGSEVRANIYFEEDGGCVTTGTLVTLADGTQKPVEKLEDTDSLLAWNFATGNFEASRILMMVAHGEKEYDVLKLSFSENVDVDVIFEHGFWDVNLNKFVYIDAENVEEYVGHWFNWQYVDESGVPAYKNIQLMSYKNSREWTNAWSPITCNNLSVYVNGLLSVSAETEGLVDIFEVNDMKYDEQKMNADIEEYGLLDYEVLAEYISRDVFDGFNGQYLKVAMEKGLINQNKIIYLIETYQEFFPKTREVQ